MQKKKPGSSIKAPNAFLYYCMVPFIRLYFHLIYHHKIDKSALRDLKPPYLVVAGHCSWLDYLITSVSMYPVRMNFVGAYNFFRSKLLKIAFEWMGVIPKHQFTSDVGAIRKIRYCIGQKRVVALFPHGCLSNEGRPGGFAVFGIAKLIRLLKVPVVAIRTDGGYLTRPRWSGSSRYGRMETKITPILSSEEIDNLSNNEIYHRVIDAIHFDDYTWQRANKVPFRSNRPAEGVEYVLYKCPGCKHEFTLRSNRNRVYCLKCGYAVRMNEYQMFEAESPDPVLFDGIDRWYDFQKAYLDEEIQIPSFELQASTELKFAEPGKYGYQHQGFGELRLTRDAIIYTGTVKQKHVNLVLPMENIPMIPYAANEYIEVANGDDIHRFILEDRRQMMKWVLAVRLIRDRFYEEDRCLK